MISNRLMTFLFRELSQFIISAIKKLLTVLFTIHLRKTMIYITLYWHCWVTCRKVQNQVLLYMRFSMDVFDFVQHTQWNNLLPEVVQISEKKFRFLGGRKWDAKKRHEKVEFVRNNSACIVHCLTAGVNLQVYSERIHRCNWGMEPTREWVMTDAEWQSKWVYGWGTCSSIWCCTLPKCDYWSFTSTLILACHICAVICRVDDRSMFSKLPLHPFWHR